MRYVHYWQKSYDWVTSWYLIVVESSTRRPGAEASVKTLGDSTFYRNHHRHNVQTESRVDAPRTTSDGSTGATSD